MSFDQEDEPNEAAQARHEARRLDPPKSQQDAYVRVVAKMNNGRLLSRNSICPLHGIRLKRCCMPVEVADAH